MFRVLEFAVVLSSLFALAPEGFYVDKLVIYTTYDSQYIIRRQNVIVPPTKLLRQEDINCLRNELTETDLFESLHIRLLRRTSDTRTIELWAKYRPDFAKLKIGEIVLKDLPEVNESTFSRALAENGIKIGDRLIAHFFVSLEEKTARALRQSVSNSRQEEYQRSALDYI